SSRERHSPQISECGSGPSRPSGRARTARMVDLNGPVLRVRILPATPTRLEASCPHAPRRLVFLPHSYPACEAVHHERDSCCSGPSSAPKYGRRYPLLPPIPRWSDAVPHLPALPSQGPSDCEGLAAAPPAITKGVSPEPIRRPAQFRPTSAFRNLLLGHQQSPLQQVSRGLNPRTEAGKSQSPSSQ